MSSSTDNNERPRQRRDHAVAGFSSDHGCEIRHRSDSINAKINKCESWIGVLFDDRARLDKALSANLAATDDFDRIPFTSELRKDLYRLLEKSFYLFQDLLDEDAELIGELRKKKEAYKAALRREEGKNPGSGAAAQ